jgi:hypothetical protein
MATKHPGQVRLTNSHEKGPNLSGLKEMVPAIGFELMTYRLQGGCSTN